MDSFSLPAHINRGRGGGFKVLQGSGTSTPSPQRARVLMLQAPYVKGWQAHGVSCVSLRGGGGGERECEGGMTGLPCPALPDPPLPPTILPCLP